MILRRLFSGRTPPPAAESPLAASAGSDAWRGELELLLAAGKFPQALAIVAEVGKGAEQPADLHFVRGRVLFAWGRLREAALETLRGVQSGFQSSNAFRQLGWCALWTLDREESEAWMAKAVEADPADWRAHFGWGTAAMAGRRTDDGLVRFKRALELAPGRHEVLNSIVVCHLDRKDSAEAESAAARAVEVDPTQSMAWANWAVAVARQRRFEEAKPMFERAMELERGSGDVTDVFANYCNCLRDAGEVDAAIALYETCLPHQPNVHAHMDYGFSLLTAGRLEDGWRQYEFRWLTGAFLGRYPNFDRPLWSGQSLRGKTILLWAEQGFGDVIQFIRYAPIVKSLGAKVLVVVNSELLPLIRGVSGIDEVLTGEGSIPPFDFHIPLMSLPMAFATGEHTIPAEIPYLRSTAELFSQWRGRLPPTDSPRVGLVWAGSKGHHNDRFRSVSFESLESILQLRRVQFISLQKDLPTAHLAEKLREMGIFNAAEYLHSFADTLALIENLDLVITVDTSVAHLAGAAGKPVWILLPNPADFRWMRDREDSPWYPQSRLFRQDARRDWKPVLARVAASLQAWRDSLVESKGVDSTPTVSGRAIPTLPSDEDQFSRMTPSLSAFARTRHGLMQYLPREPIEGVSLAIYGESREAEVRLLVTVVRVGGVVLESNAGIGTHSIPLSRAIGAAGHYLAYESRPTERRILATNLAANGVFNATVLLRKLGASPMAGSPDRVALSAAATTGRVADAPGAVDSVDSMGLDRLDLLKLNDGAQAAMDIISGAEESLWRLRPVVFIRVESDSDLNNLGDRIKAYSYRCWRHEVAMFPSDNFNLSERDVFSGRTALAILAIPEEFGVAGALDGCTEIG